jgi:hypothetical protein
MSGGIKLFIPSSVCNQISIIFQRLTAMYQVDELPQERENLMGLAMQRADLKADNLAE